ncbi:hypothetical protein C3F09_00340 [candidate division GN15 bacterium]|uniref:Uncharacterized protein n=1 Tax=candidate division GN15 bacterium TaxID=2072418 RepID=A0A855X5N5_9BACT|nr:MAG: hypothetical protein C3F09_00340 [candidate division GN15 bacterium]
MTEARRKKILYVVLVAAVIFGIYNFSQPRKRYVPGDMTQAEQSPAPTVAPAAPSRPPVNIDGLRKASWGRDPFRRVSHPQPEHRNTPVVSQPESAPGWKLSAIVFSSSMPLAIVNGKAVKVGDIVDRAKVVAIDQKKVTLLYNGANIEIRVGKG